MLVEQFLKDLQDLIARGTLNPSAEIEVRGELTLSNDDYEFTDVVSSDKLRIAIHESCYNKLILFIKED